MKLGITFKTLAAALLLITPLRAQVYTFNPNLTIPDGNATGISDVQTVTGAGTSITDITVNLSIAGEWNGDLYVYLRHGTGFSVLLNQVGVTVSDSFGYSDRGFNITLRDSAANDVHFYRDHGGTPAPGQPVTGEWQPDARFSDPLGGRTTFLDSFEGVDPNGEWTLFAADLSTGSTHQLQSWGMQLTVVPEPRQTAAFAAAVLLAFAWFRRQRSSIRR
jgi:subtilisin-like proprotein convertase family protein